jgi:hypothetical protein
MPRSDRAARALIIAIVASAVGPFGLALLLSGCPEPEPHPLPAWAERPDGGARHCDDYCEKCVTIPGVYDCASSPSWSACGCDGMPSGMR